MCEVQFSCVSSDECVEMRHFPARFGSQNSPQSLRFFLPRAKGPRHLDQNIRVWQIDCEVADFGKDQMLELTLPELAVEVFAFLCRRGAGDDRQIKSFR